MIVMGRLGVLITCWKLLRFGRWGDEVPHVKTFFVYALLLTLELTTENFFVWSDHRIVKTRVHRVCV